MATAQAGHRFDRVPELHQEVVCAELRAGGPDVCAFLWSWPAPEVACARESRTGLLLCLRGTSVLRANLVKLGQRSCQAVPARSVGRDHIRRRLDLANNASAFVIACLAHLATRMVGCYSIQGQQDCLDGDERARCFAEFMCRNLPPRLPRSLRLPHVQGFFDRRVRMRIGA